MFQCPILRTDNSNLFSVKKIFSSDLMLWKYFKSYMVILIWDEMKL